MKRKFFLTTLITIACFAVMAQGGVVMNATFTPTDAPYNQHGTLRMESYVTGATVTTEIEVTQACDIVLVLDQSGSMISNNMGNITRQEAMKAAVKNFITEVNGKYSDDANHRIALVTYGNSASTLKDWTYADNVGMNALKNAITSLSNPSSLTYTHIDAGLAQAKTLITNLKNKNDYDNSRKCIVIVFTDGVPTHDGSGEFQIEVADESIETAKELKDDDVIIYSIGIFENADANELYGSEGFKTNSDGSINSKWEFEETNLFILGDAYEADIPAANRFLNYISSNFKNADSIGLIREKQSFWLVIAYINITYTIQHNFTQNASSYYLTANDATGLNNIFTTIAKQEVTGGADNATITSTTVNKGVLSEYFKLPEGINDNQLLSDNSIIKIAKCTSVTKNDKGEITAYNFGEPITGNGIKTALGNDANITLHINKDTKEIWCDGFDYSANWCGPGNRQKSTEPANGYMLIMEIPVEIDEAGLNKMWKNPDEISSNGDRIINAVPINTEKSGLYYTTGMPIVNYESVETSVASSAYLPVELLSFTAECISNAIQFNWSTATETNNEYFTIERSEDAINYTEVARIQGAGTSATQNDYSFMADNNSSRMLYYRLRQTDINGTTEVFEPIAVQCSATETADISIYPVPAKNRVTIESNQNIEKVEIFSMQGYLIKNIVCNHAQVNIDLNNLNNGMFLIRITTANGESMVKKLIKN